MSLRRRPLRRPLPVLFLATMLLAATVGFPSGSAIPASQTVTLTGWFQVAYGDTPGSGADGPGHVEVTRFELLDDLGQSHDLAIEPGVLASAGGQRGLNRRRVTLTGELTPSAPPLVVVRTIQAVLPPAGVAASAGLDAPQAVAGPQPWVTILCQFSDWPSYEPHPISYYQGLVGNAYPGLNHFWQEVSYSRINITGSIVVGWFVLPQPRSSYFIGSSFDLNRAFNDCTAQANASVNFPDYIGINLMFNRNLDGFSWGGTRFATLDGVAKIYSTTWIAETHQAYQYVLAHEMGHGFGLPHSSGPYSTPYDSEWDPMSNGGTCSPVHPVYSCLGVHTVSHHKDILGWIAAARQVTVPPGAGQTVVLERLGQPISGTSLLLARIPIGGSSTNFYTVEARRFAGYDTQVPGEGIVIHKVDTTLSDREAQVVDPDNNGNPNDAAAIWLPGETFTDTANAIVVAVEAATATGYQVTIQNAYDEDPPGTVALGASAYSVTEGGVATITVTRQGATGTAVTVPYATSNGSATAGTHYTAAAGTLSFAAGVTSQSFSVATTGNTVVDGNRTVNLSLGTPSGGGALLGSPSTAVLTIANDDVAGSVQFSAAAYTVSEGVSSATITVTRSGGAASNVSVQYATSNGTAGAADYNSSSGTLSFGAGVTSRTFSVPILPDTLAEGPETVLLTLSNPGGGASLGTPKTATLTIADNDPAGTLKLSQSSYSVGEGAGSATITVSRSGGTAGGVSVAFATRNGTAVAGTDYTATSGILSFGSGQTTRSVTVPITNDTLANGTRTFTVTLSAPSPGASLGSPTSATVTIIDNEGGLRFSAAAYGVVEGKSAIITVTRGGSTSSAASVRYATSNGTAVAGTHYTATGGTLSFGAGVASRSFTVSTRNDAVVNGSRTVKLTLSNPGGTGATLGSPSSAVLTITDNDGGSSPPPPPPPSGQRGTRP